MEYPQRLKMRIKVYQHRECQDPSCQAKLYEPVLYHDLRRGAAVVLQQADLHVSHYSDDNEKDSEIYLVRMEI